MISGIFAEMIPFEAITHSEPALAHSPMLRAALLTFEYIEARGPIELTPSKALKRYFVAWAAEAFAWPNYTAADLYAANKVLNEQDFPPLVVLHDLLLSTKLARHYQGSLQLTKLGKDLGSKPGELWLLLTRHLLFLTDHSQYSRFDGQFTRDWLTHLNAINVEAELGISEAELCATLYGGEASYYRREGYQRGLELYLHVLRPLCWVGLLAEHITGRGLQRSELFFKTPLWAAALRLPSDEQVARPTLH
jgi:hypothetical protein